MLRMTLAQLNYTIGDIEGNADKMIAAARQAHDARSRMVVFSELSLTGYYPADLITEPGFMGRVEEGLDAIKAASRRTAGLYWVIGAPMCRKGPGKRFSNEILVIHDGEIVLEYAKQLLPTYNIFDESRHFEPGPEATPVLELDGLRIGFLICEDGWNDEGQDYVINPFHRMKEHGINLVVSINGSPSQVGWRERRHAVLGAASARNELPVLYVNQIGGHDQLVYDGASFAVEPERGVVFEAARFEEEVRTLVLYGGRFLDDTGMSLPGIVAEGLSNMAFYRAQIVLGIRDYARRCGFRQVVVGSSGGIDSALVLALAVEALGPENVMAITMPSVFSSAGSVEDSARLCKNLGIELRQHPIAPIVDAFTDGFDGAFDRPLQGLPLENLQARVRGTILMEYSNTFGHLLLTTGNKSEISVGYCTLYGDTNGGLGPIGDLYKTEVFALCRHLNETNGREIIPTTILEKPPSAELAPGQKDTDSLPPYEVLDEILKWLIEGRLLEATEFAHAEEYVSHVGGTSEGVALIDKLRRMIARNEYKRRQAPPIIRVRGRAFGVGRQLPIAARHY